MTLADVRDEASAVLAPNYHPLPVTLVDGLGSWVTDDEGRRYLDLLSGYSALNFGHRHPVLTAAAHAQLDRLTLTSRAFDHELLVPFAERLAALVGPLVAGPPMVLPMNTGAEAVETAIKAARKWGYDVKGVPAGPRDDRRGRRQLPRPHDDDRVVLHRPRRPARLRPVHARVPGRPYGDAAALADAIDETTVAVLLEPIQGEQGVVIPPVDYLPGGPRRSAREHDVLFIADEIQSGLGRTGTTLASELWGVKPDLVTLGKALGGGVMPVSAVVGRADVLGVLTAGTHGSTFGGNPLACAVGLAVVGLPGDRRAAGPRHDAGPALGRPPRRARRRGPARVVAPRGPVGRSGRHAADDPARQLCERLLARGVLAKDTHGSTIRLAPPLTITPRGPRPGHRPPRRTPSADPR